MPSPSSEPDVARMLARAVRECPPGHDAWLGQGIAQLLSPELTHQRTPSPGAIAFVETSRVSPAGLAADCAAPQTIRTVIGLSNAAIDSIGDLIGAHDRAGVGLRRLICPFAVFEFGVSGPIVREVARGITAADLQARLSFPLWAGPDLQELMAP
ncbi:MAG: hypothetical protein AAGF92_01065 [Myxococcota bacterium]